MLARLHYPPKAASLRALASRRHVSTAPPTRQNTRITTILTTDTSNKAAFLSQAQASLAAHQHLTSPAPPFTAALLLSSRALAPWLSDPAFILPLLRLTAPHGPPASLSVLAAAVDALSRPEDGPSLSSPLSPSPQSTAAAAAAADGITIIHGAADTLLPDLWAGARAAPQGNPDAPAALVFAVPSGLGPQRPLRVTVPAASTVFQTGRAATAFASRWAAGPEDGSWEALRLVERRDVAEQVVRLPPLPCRRDDGGGGGGHLQVRLPLVPATPLRAVRAALGNVLRRVGADAPASRELEEAVPLLLAARRRRGLPELAGPLDVWALVVPGRLARHAGVCALRGRGEGGMGDGEEGDAIDFRSLLRDGCRLHKVLSGGGGWGAKQGLLSLDPQTRFATTDQEDVDSFERDFLAGQVGGGGSVVGPGDEVMFFVDAETHPARPARRTEPRRPKRFVVRVGARPTEAEELARPTELPTQPLGAAGVQVIDGFLGVVSTTMFVAPEAAPDSGRGGMAASIKIDTPGAELFLEQSQDAKEEAEEANRW